MENSSSKLFKLQGLPEKKNVQIQNSNSKTYINGEINHIHPVFTTHGRRHFQA